MKMEQISMQPSLLSLSPPRQKSHQTKKNPQNRTKKNQL